MEEDVEIYAVKTFYRKKCRVNKSKKISKHVAEKEC